MANEIIVKIVLDDKGSLKSVEQEATKTARSLEEVGDSSLAANRGLKGVSQAGANGTKNFSKMAGTLNGVLVPAYATVAATVFAATAVFNNFQKAAQVDNLAKGLQALGTASGQNLGQLSQDLRNATEGAISLEQSLRATALATSAGISPDEFIKLGEGAKNASLALGRDLADSLDRLTRGVGKLEPEILDELGLIIRVDEAAEKYAGTLGKTASQLTNTEKRQAFLNEALSQLDDKFGDIGDQIPVDGFTKLAASVQDALKSVSSFLNEGAEPLAGFLAKAPGLIVGLGLAFAGTVTKQILPGLQEVAKQSEQSSKEAIQNLENLAEARDAVRKDKLSGAQASLKEIDSKASKEALELVREGKDLEAAKIKISRSIIGFKGAEKKINEEITARKEEIINLEKLQTSEAQKRLEVAKGELRVEEAKLQANKAKVSAAESAITSIDEAGPATLTGRERDVEGRLKGEQALARTRIGAFEALDDRTLSFGQKLKKGIDSTKQSFRDVQTNLEGTDVRFKKVRASAAAAGTAVKFFGTALVRALPFIGIAITAFQLLAPLATKLSEAIRENAAENNKLSESSERVAEALKAQQESTQETIEVLEKRIKRLQEAKNAEENLNKILAIQAKISIATAENLLNTSDSLRDLRENAENYKPDLLDKFLDALGANNPAEQYREALIGTLEEIPEDASKISSLVEKALELNPRGTQLERILRRDVNNALGSGSLEELKTALSNILEGIDPGRLDELVKSLGSTTEVSEEGTKALTKQSNALKELTNESKAFGQSLEKALSAETISTPIDTLVSSFRGQVNALDDLSTDGEKLKEGLGSLLENVPSLEKILDIDLANDKIEESVDKVQDFFETLENSQKAYRKIAAETKLVNALQKEASQLSSQSAEATEISISLQKRLKRLEIETLKQRQSLLETTKGGQDEVLKIQNEINAIEAEIGNEKLDNLRIQQANFQQAKKLLDVQNQTKQVSRDIVDFENKSLRIKQQLENFRRTGETRLTPEQDVKFAQEEAKIAKENAQAIFEERKASLENEKNIKLQEFKILKERKSLLAEQLKNLGIERENIGQRQKEKGISGADALIAEGKAIQAAAEKANESIAKDGSFTALETATEELFKERLRLLGIERDYQKDTADLVAAVALEKSQAFFKNLEKRNKDLKTQLEFGPGRLNQEIASQVNTFRSEQGRPPNEEELNRIKNLSEEQRNLQDMMEITNGIANSFATNMTNAFMAIANGTKSAKDAFKDMALSILADIAQMLIRMAIMRAVSSAFGGFFGSGGIATPPQAAPPARYGGVLEAANGGMFTNAVMGGIAKGKDAGYPAILHGTEAVVPLPNGKEIPVQMLNSGQNNNVSVNINMEGGQVSGQSEEAQGQNSALLGRLIAGAVQRELQEQQRPGGVLSPYGGRR